MITLTFLATVLITHSHGCAQLGPHSSRHTTAKLEAARDAGNNPLMRGHAWNVLLDICRPVTSSTVLWESFIPKDLSISSRKALDDAAPWISHLTEPIQLRANQPHILPYTGKPHIASLGDRPSYDITSRLLVDVRFNKAARTHIEFQGLDSLTKLEKLVGSKSEIVPFPEDSIAIKAIWWPVKKEGLSLLPVWDGIPLVDDAAGIGPGNDQFGNDYARWRRYVAIDPELHVGRCATAQVHDPDWRFLERNSSSPVMTVPVAALSQFYNRTITADEIAKIKNLPTSPLGLAFNYLHGRPPLLEGGDKLVLVGLHVATKRLSDWIWITIWWHDAPTYGAFAEQRPPELTGPWHNYLMDVTFNADLPKEKDTAYNVCFNPWLEAPLQGGLTSNCLACHQRAALGHPDLSIEEFDAKKVASTVTRGKLAKDDEYFKQKLQVDYMWSLLQLHSDE